MKTLIKTFALLTVLLLCIPGFAQNQKKPVIGISCSIDGTTVEVGMTYVKSVRKAGGIPFIIPITTDEKEIDEYLDRIDGLLMTGGKNPAALTEPLPGNGSSGQGHLRLGLDKESHQERNPGIWCLPRPPVPEHSNGRRPDPGYSF